MTARPAGRRCRGVAVWCGVVLLAAAPALATTDSIHFSDRLQQLMRRMNTLVYDRNQTELALDRERLERARELASAARELAAEAGAAPPTSLDADTRREFMDYAHALAGEAARLDELAAARRFSELAAQMERVGHQCAACHLRFRVRTP